jgi:ABC-type nitrate/sulfonate/bicarbonate transport system substrate-binding protein
VETNGTATVLPFRSRTAAWERGDIDAAFIWAPVLTNLKKSGTVLASAGDMRRGDERHRDRLALQVPDRCDPGALAGDELLGVIRAMASGNVDVGEAGSSPVAAAASQGLPITLFLQLAALHQDPDRRHHVLIGEGDGLLGGDGRDG